MSKIVLVPWYIFRVITLNLWAFLLQDCHKLNSRKACSYTVKARRVMYGLGNISTTALRCSSMALSNLLAKLCHIDNNF